MARIAFFAIVPAVLVALGTLAVMCWIGVSMLVPSHPFEERNIAGGVCMLVFMWLSMLVAGLGTWFLCGGCCEVCGDDAC